MLMAILAALAVAVLAVVMLALATPLRVDFRLGTDPGGTALRLAPLNGVLGEVSVPHRTVGRPATATQPHPLRGQILRALPQFLLELAERVRIDRLRVSARFGTGDPALTGQIYGQLMPLVHGPFLPPAAELRLSPDFDRAGLAGDAEVVLRVIPLRLAGPLLRLAWAGYGRS